MFIKHKKNINVLIVLFTVVINMTGCDSNSTINHQDNSTINQQENITTIIEEEKNYQLKDIENAVKQGWWIDEIHWISNEKIVANISVDGQNDSEYLNNIYLFDIKNDSGKLIHEGIYEEYWMDGNTFVNIDDSRFALFSNAYYLEFEEGKLITNYHLKEKFDAVFGAENYQETSVNINKNGEGSLLVNGEIVVFDIHNIEDYQIIVRKTETLVSQERMDELIEQGVINVYREVPQTYYWQPLFSPDGEKILYNERESTEHHESSVVIYDRTTQKQQSFEFMYMDTYLWGADCKNVVACTWPTYAEYPEIRIYNLASDSYQSYVFDQPVNEKDIRDIGILDTNETTVLFRGIGPKTAFDSTFELDIETGNIECIEEQSTRFHATKLSPDGRRVVFGFSRGDTVGIKIIDLDDAK